MTRTVTLLPFLAMASLGAHAQVPSGFTAHHNIQFAPGTDPIRKILSGDPSLRGLVAGSFLIAREDLNDDGSKEMILIAQESISCGSGGCSFVVLESRAGRIVTILSGNVAGTLSVTNEKVGQYRGLASVDDKGTILLGDKPQTPLFGKQLVYTMNVSEAAPARQAAPPGPPGRAPDAQRQAGLPSVAGPAVCGSQAFCTENLSFAATITDFQAILENGNTKTLTLRMRLQNKLNRPLTLGYVSGSGVAADDRGNRYVPAGQRAVQGIGLVQGNSGDPKFILQPGESSDARFELVWNSSGQIFGLSFQVDVAIREIDPIPGNQMRLGREHALHFSGLGNPATAPASAAPRITTAAPAPVPRGTPAAVAAAPGADACAGRQRCYSAGPFAAEITSLTPSFSDYTHNTHMMQARVRFWNLTNQPVILASVPASAVITDNYGGRYTNRSQQVSGDGVKGIGVVQGDVADPQFVLAPGASGDAAFTVSRRLVRNGPMGSTFSFDLSIAQLEVLPSRQIRTIREHTLGFAQLSANASTTTNASAPSLSNGVIPQSDACAAKPRCYSAGAFTAEITGLAASFADNRNRTHLLQAKVRFLNLTNQPLILSYVAGSAVFVDEHGGRYWIRQGGNGTEVQAIGVVQGNSADPQFVLAPGASRDAAFIVSRVRSGQADPMGSTFSFDVAIAQLEVLASQQIRTVREYAVGIPNLTASGPSLLNRLLQGTPQK